MEGVINRIELKLGSNSRDQADLPGIKVHYGYDNKEQVESSIFKVDKME